MMKHLRDVRQLATGLGLDEVRLECGGKHHILYACYRRRPLRVVIASTPSDKRSQRNTKAEIRRAMRAIDAKPTPMPL